MLTSVLKFFFKVNFDDLVVKYWVDFVVGVLCLFVNMFKCGVEIMIGVVILVFFVLVYLMFELMSRKYYEDFEVFYDYDYWFGYVLVFMCVVFVVLFIVVGGLMYVMVKL